MTVNPEHDTNAAPQDPRPRGALPFALSADHEAQIREAARSALAWSFIRLAEERVLPRSPYRPWISMARDYFGGVVEGEGGQLARALAAALPERFPGPGRLGVDYPWNYASALLEAAVAAATRVGEPYELASSSVRATIDELIAKVQAIPRSTVLQVVADVDVDHPATAGGDEDRWLGETVEFAGVRVMRVENMPERYIERELPSAGYEVERFQVVVHPGPASLLAATVEEIASYSDRVTEARRQVQTLIAAIRLAAGTTAHSVIDIEGEPERVRWISPAITPLPSWGYRWVYRPVTVSSADKPGLEHLVSLIGSWGKDTGWAAVQIALGRLSRSLDGLNPRLMDQVVDLSIGLEAALAGTDRNEIGLRLRTRAAGILATDADPPEMIYRDVKTLYDLRSTFVHGAGLTEKEVGKAIRRVSGVAAARWPAEQYLVALDRWRDLLRRAILARIALATAGVRWTAGLKGGDQVDVDELLLREKDRFAWRDHILAFWVAGGLPQALNPAPAARFLMSGAT